MKRNSKKKLLVVVGAGASIEAGMPSVSDIDHILEKEAVAEFALSQKPDRSLYAFFRDSINAYYDCYEKRGLVKQTNFEEVIYAMMVAGSMGADPIYQSALNGVMALKDVPTIVLNRKAYRPDGYDILQLCEFLVDVLLREFRRKCILLEEQETPELKKIKRFYENLALEYDTAFLTLNYDNLVSQSCPELFTGFDGDGTFDQVSVWNQKKWGLNYHLHGCVHFDMRAFEDDLHTIFWNRNLRTCFRQNAFGRSPKGNAENLQVMTSAIVAGYGKLFQIQRKPFRTYFAEIDKLVAQADTFLFLGYGFNDTHFNECFHSVRRNASPRPIVIVDYGHDDQDAFQISSEKWVHGVCNTLTVDKNEMATRKWKHACPHIASLRENNEFEVSRNERLPLAVWYGGMLKACDHYDFLKGELEYRY